MQLSVIVPVYNEEQYLRIFITDLLKRLNKAQYNFELILSENGSTDNTRKLARSLTKIHPRLKLLTSPVPNYGLAVKKGFLKARGTYLVLFDLDYYHLGFLKKALNRMSRYDAIVASKRNPSSTDTRSFTRRLATQVFSSILKLFFNLEISDTHGMKLLNRKKFLPLIKKTKFTKEIFDTELLILAQRNNLRLGEVPIRVIEKRQSRSSIISRATRTLKDLLLLRIYLSKS